ncbi:MAG: heavy metal-binding domain-containing protein [Hyphomicrobiaceae bacterium]
MAGVGAFLQTIKGGNITIYTKLAEDARADAHARLIAHAEELGANAILALRYDANEINAGVTEVLAYGTAVVVELQQ